MGTINLKEFSVTIRETIRLSIGFEDADDLINDLKQAFKESLR